MSHLPRRQRNRATSKQSRRSSKGNKRVLTAKHKRKPFAARAKHKASMIREGKPRASKVKHNPRRGSTSGDGKALAPMAKHVPQWLSTSFHDEVRTCTNHVRAARALDADTYLGEGWGMSCYPCMPDNQNLGQFTATICAAPLFQ
jgi:hypothetical protein